MGNVALGMKTLCQALKIPYVLPEKNNKSTLQTGSYYSPEEICLPFKLILGNFIQSIEKGADTVLSTGSCGPCRFGEYCERVMKILRKIGYRHLEFIVADLSSEIGMGEFMRRIRKISDASLVSKADKIQALYTAFKVVESCDKIDAKAYNMAGYEMKRGECRHILNEYKTKASDCDSPEEMITLLNLYKNKLDGIRLDKDKDPLKISIIGEIFTIIEPSSNFYIEEKLMDYGVSTKRMLSPSWWIKDMIKKPVKLDSIDIKRAAKAYMPYAVGGHGKECIGEAVLAKDHGMDGGIQIFPLGCMPEIIAKSILPAIQRDKDLPIMSLIVDEVAGEAGYVTRVEAFLDMLQSRKNAQKKLVSQQAAFECRK
jgi:predicted nucleotide-binding protein (sugar kinase/HSP70/actin superfamily)